MKVRLILSSVFLLTAVLIALNTSYLRKKEVVPSTRAPQVIVPSMQRNGLLLGDDISLEGWVPGDVLKKKDTEAQASCLFRALDRQELVDLMLHQKTSFSDLTNGKCSHQERVLVYSAEELDGMRSLRAMGRRRDGRIEISGLILPQRALEVPLCEQCDEVWLGPQDVNESEFDNIVIATPAPPEKLPLKRAVHLPRPFPLNFKNWAPATKFNGRVLLVSERSYNMVDGRLAAEIKRRGAKQVIWYWPGLRQLSKERLRPPSLVGVHELSWSDLQKLLETTTLLIDLRPRTQNLKITFPAAQFFDDLDPGVTGDRLKAPVIVFGFNDLDFRAYDRVRVLIERGYQKILWFRDGARAYEERQQLGQKD